MTKNELTSLHAFMLRHQDLLREVHRIACSNDNTIIDGEFEVVAVETRPDMNARNRHTVTPTVRPHRMHLA